MRHFVPMCRYNFIFCVEPETIRSRKQELEVEDMKRIYSRLEYLCVRDKRYYKIDNNGTPEDAVRQILDVLAKK
jgi:ribose 1,5-bisphosphokinase PhnN